ncbi:MAG: tRNA (adenosine(37)-N6)-dimethylallyltransferase MiaA [Ghiorsea sp.]
MEKHPPLKAIALMGATGSGKSGLAMRLAAAGGTCLVSCDSMQVYRGLDIGTAKPTKDEQLSVRHALIDCVDVTDTWSAQTWADAARKVIQSENAQGKMPIIVGGTGMYLKALLEGFATVPAEKEGVRVHFEEIQQQKGTEYLYAQLKTHDEILANRLEPQDTQRIIRGLSVFESTGTPLSTWHAQQDQVKKETQSSINCPIFVLEVDRELLRERIAKRFYMMMEQGWLAEVQWLQNQGLADTHPVMRSVGYRQLLNHLEAQTSLESAITDGITATRRYAKRQRTWFNNQTPNAKRGDTELLCEEIKIVIG